MVIAAKIFGHIFVGSILIACAIAYGLSVRDSRRSGTKTEVHGHVIFWLAFLALGAMEVIFYLHDFGVL